MLSTYDLPTRKVFRTFSATLIDEHLGLAKSTAEYRRIYIITEGPDTWVANSIKQVEYALARVA